MKLVVISNAQRVTCTTQGHTVVAREKKDKPQSPFVGFSSHSLTRGYLKLRVLCVCPDAI